MSPSTNDVFAKLSFSAHERLLDEPLFDAETANRLKNVAILLTFSTVFIAGCWLIIIGVS